jgi:hypothetical protein
MAEDGKSNRNPTQRQAELAKFAAKYELANTILRPIGWSLLVASSYIPIYALTSLVQAVAGKETVVRVDVMLAISVAINIPAGIVSAVLWKKTGRQKTELARGRERQKKLEEALAEAKRASKEKTSGKRDK